MIDGQYFIGTSGWIYRHWRDIFYPRALPQKCWFEHYARYFGTVEINYSFYRLPSEDAFDQWRRQAPAGFVYAVKANRYLTHVKRLKDAEEPLERFLGRARRLGDRLGPILYQLPPRWNVNPGLTARTGLERLEAFVRLLPRDLIHVFEFRDPSWLVEPVFDLLAEHNLSFCVMSMPGMDCPIRATSRVVYIRMHGSGVIYGGKYSRSELAEWADHARRFLAEGRDVYVYFNNDAWGCAVENALELRAMLGGER